jgi:hypothetical protein
MAGRSVDIFASFGGMAGKLKNRRKAMEAGNLRGAAKAMKPKKKAVKKKTAKRKSSSPYSKGFYK